MSAFCCGGKPNALGFIHAVELAHLEVEPDFPIERKGPTRRTRHLSRTLPEHPEARKVNTGQPKRWMPKIAIVAALVGGAFLAWQAFRPERLPEGLASGNGRIEAVEIDVAAKTPGRLEDILVREGDFVRSGQILARTI